MNLLGFLKSPGQISGSHNHKIYNKCTWLDSSLLKNKVRKNIIQHFHSVNKKSSCVTYEQHSKYMMKHTHVWMNPLE